MSANGISSSRLLNRSFKLRLIAVVLASAAVSLLDAMGIALVVPLVAVLADSTGDAPALPLGAFDGMSATTLLALMVSFFVLKSAGMAAIRWWTTGIVTRQNARTATDLFAAYLAADINFHSSRSSSEAMAMIANTLRNYFVNGIMALIMLMAETTTLLILVTILMLASPLASLVGFAYFGVLSLVYVRLVQARTRSRAREALRLNALSIKSVQEALGGLREHRVRGTVIPLLMRFGDERSRLEASNRYTSFASELSRYYLEIMFIGGFGAVAIAVMSSGGSTESLAALAIFLTVGFRVLPSISRLMAASNNLRIGRTALASILDELDLLGIERLERQTLSRPVAGVAGAGDGPADICLAKVSFCYPSADRPTLQDVSITIPPGSSVGLVGPSGAGKSTLVDVLCGLQRPSSGSILSGGLDIASNLTDWQSRIGFVPQHPYLLDASVAENVTFGLERDDPTIWEALERAQLQAVISSMPAQLEQSVGEGGSRLSGGQRQRLAIARALYRRPGILILDEATAALDGETEAAIVETIDSLAGEVTVLVVAHRLSTVLHCDQIVYVDQGRVRSAGPLEQVVAEVPEFARALNRTSAVGNTAVDLD